MREKRPGVGAVAIELESIRSGPAMNTIDYIYRFDPKNPSSKPASADADAARRKLEKATRCSHAGWRAAAPATSRLGEPGYVVQCNGLEVGMNRTTGQLPKQAPFAVVVGCSDARVPTRDALRAGIQRSLRHSRRRQRAG